ncbi:MAG TPA: hypothetical protein VN903_10100, partial [Polyangia bacterium]|nr:hypothetical protein [Polyangia bacterium]
MNLAMWPATLGYFAEQMMNPWVFLNDPATSGSQAVFSDATVDAMKKSFIDNVFGRGPGPAFRVGAVPYGVLPAIALSRWVPATGENTVAPDTMRRLISYWQSAAAALPAVTRASADPNTDLMKVLSQKASSDSVFVRNSVGVQTVTTLWDLDALEWGVLLDEMKRIQDPILNSLAHLDWIVSRVLEVTFFGNAYRYKGPLVTANPDGGKFASGANYLAKLASRDLKITDIDTQDSMPEAGPSPKPLLFLMLRHALLLQAVKIGRRISPQAFVNVTRLEVELFGFINESQLSVMDLLKQSDSGTTFFDVIKDDPEYKFYAQAIKNLQDLPVRDLERMFTESLDLGAHRLDAWITALGTRRLRLNAIERAFENYVGGYGWVEDVRPASRGTRTVEGFTAEVQSNSGGFIHAPSMRHAKAAAILRSGRMAEKSDPTKYAIELPSERARRAHRLTDGMRNEQPLGALLGYEFEKGMRARGVNGTEGFILALRKLYPLVAHKAGIDGTDPSDQVAARNVVDGKVLRETAAPIGPGLPFGSQGLPPTFSDGEKAITAEVARLSEIVDSLADLALSETVFQVAGGDVSTAGAVMSALSDGERPPEPEITLSPTVGAAVSHRASLIFQGIANPAAVAGWSVTTPRSRLERFLDGYVANLLGTIDDVTAKIEYTQGGTAKTDPAFQLSKLAIGALDFVALAQAPATAGQGSVLDRRLKDAFLAQTANAGATITKITYNPPPAATPTTPLGRSIPQLLEVARAIATVIGNAREMRPADLRRAEDTFDTATLDGVLTFAFNDIVQGRIVGASTALTSALQALDGDPRAGLKSAADFVPEAFPDPDATDAELTAAVDGARAELLRRQADFNAAQLPFANTNLAPQIDGAVTGLRIVFGRSTIAIVPPFAISWSQELFQSLKDQNPASAPPDVRRTPERYLQQVMRVRDRLGSWRRVGLYAGALGRTAAPLTVAQLPFVAGEPWAGHSVPEQGRLSLLLLSGDRNPPLVPDTTKTWRGLILDEWTETVPGNKVQTGLAFHYDSQAAKAPNVILTCVHSGAPAPSGQNTWSFTELEAIVNETIDLARIRPVDSDQIALGQLMPAVVLAANTQNKTISTLFPNSTLEIPPIIVG